MVEVATTNELLSAALEYAAKYDFRVIPCYPRTKKPIGDDWPNRATTDTDVIEKWWAEFPAANVGVKLGPESGIIDAECDSAEEEKSLAELFGGEFPVTPTFQSGRGKHRLFKWRKDFPETDSKGIIKIGGVGFRTGGAGKGAQSVFPPSIHESGRKYTWLIHPSKADIAEIPDEAMARIWNHDSGLFSKDRAEGGKPLEHWEAVSKGAGEGSRNETAASLVGRLLRSLGNVFNADDVQIQWGFVQDWNRRNKPPLPDHELETVFRSILQRERHRRLGENSSEEVTQQRSWTPETGKTEVPQWRLVVVESKPRVYKLFSPLWSLKAPLGYVALGAGQMLDWSAIRRQVLEQADVWVGRSHEKKWNGDKDTESLARQLVESATFEKAPIEGRRDLVAAEMLWEQLARARQLDEGMEPDNMRVCRLPDGGLVFKFFKALEPMTMSSQRVTREELADVLDRIGGKDFITGARDSRRRFKLISADSEKKLRKMIGIGDE